MNLPPSLDIPTLAAMLREARYGAESDYNVPPEVREARAVRAVIEEVTLRAATCAALGTYDIGDPEDRAMAVRQIRKSVEATLRVGNAFNIEWLDEQVASIKDEVYMALAESADARGAQ